MTTYLQYAELIKPTWAPPAWLFGPVWSVLYLGIAITFGTVFYQAYKRRVSWTVAVPFVLNLICNAAFTPLQFGLKNLTLASVDIVLVVATLVWALYALWRGAKRLRWIVYANIPYLLWCVFAMCLQLTITFLNS